MYLRKFYSPTEEGWQGATADTVKIVATNVPGLTVTAPPPVTETVQVPAPTNDPKPPEPVPPAQVVPDATPAQTIQAPTDVPVVKPESVVPATAPPVPTPQAIKDWKQDLKERGFDDDFIKMADYRLKTGTIKPYLEAVSVDFKGMTAEQVLKRKIQEDYPTFTPAQVERKFMNDSKDKYKQDDEKYDAEDVDLGKAEMNAEAETTRNKFIERQNQFTIPDKDLSAEQQFQQQEQARIQEEDHQFVSNVLMTSNIGKTMLTEKKIVFDLGEGAFFNYGIEDPQSNFDIMLDRSKTSDAVSTKDAAGNKMPDAKKLLLASIIFKGDADKFVREIYKQGLSDGLKNFHDKNLENNQTSGTPTPVAGGLTLAEAWKQNGKRVGF